LRTLPRLAEELRGGSLIEAGFVFPTEDANRFEQTECPKSVGVGRVLRRLERYLHVRLRSEVVNLVGLRLLGDVHQAAPVGHVAVVQDKAPRGDVWVLVEVVDALGVEQGRAALDPVNHVTLGEEKLRQVGAVLSGDTGDERDFLLFHEGGYCSVHPPASRLPGR